MATQPIDYAALAAQARQAAPVDYNALAEQAKQSAAAPAEQPKEGLFHALGSDLLGILKSAPHMLPPVMAYDKAKEFVANYESVRDTGKTLDQRNAEERAKAGHGLAYQVGAGVNEQLGVNVKGEEQAADRGDVGGVIGHAAAVPLVMAATEGLSRGASALGNKLAPVAKSQAAGMYESALKPSTTLDAAQRARVVQTGLQNEIPVSKGGVDRLYDLMDDVNSKIAQTVASDPTKTVNKFDVARRLKGTADQFRNQVNPESDVQAVMDSGNEFVRNQPTNIPAVKAQALKQGTYQQLKSKAYGEMQTASVEAQKSLARGLKEELAKQFPELNQLNAMDSKLLDLEPILQKAVARNGNHQMIGIGTPIAGSAAGILTKSAKVAAVAATLKAVLDNPMIKSRIAIALGKAPKAVPYRVAMARINGYGALLGNAASQQANSEEDKTPTESPETK